MSNAFLRTAANNLPPVVPIEFTADDSTTAIPASNNLNVLSRDTTENNANGIQTTADPDNSDNLYVELTNRLQGTVSTAGAVTGDLLTFDLGATPGTYKFVFNIAGFDSATPAGLGYDIDATLRTDGATATVISTPDGDEDEDVVLLNADWDVIGSGNNAIVRVTGVAGLNINWSLVGYYVFVS
jgi:hypothetical protein